MRVGRLIPQAYYVIVQNALVNQSLSRPQLRRICGIGGVKLPALRVCVTGYFLSYGWTVLNTKPVTNSRNHWKLIEQKKKFIYFCYPVSKFAANFFFLRLASVAFRFFFSVFLKFFSIRLSPRLSHLLMGRRIARCQIYHQTYLRTCSGLREIFKYVHVLFGSGLWGFRQDIPIFKIDETSFQFFCNTCCKF